MSTVKYVKTLQTQVEASQKVINDLVQENYFLKQKLLQRNLNENRLSANPQPN